MLIFQESFCFSARSYSGLSHLMQSQLGFEVESNSIDSTQRTIQCTVAYGKPQQLLQNSNSYIIYSQINYKKFFISKQIFMIRLFHRSVYRMSLDFSNLAQPIVTNGQRNYQINVQNPIDGYLTKNAKSKENMHTVILIHEWWGFNKSITSTAQIFSNQNIRVFVPDLYRGKAAIDAEDAGHKMNGLNWPLALQDIKLIKDHFAKDSKSVSIIGFCMGGALSLASVASIQGFKAAGVFYGIPDLNIFRLDKITAKVIAHFGRLDPLKGFSDPDSADKLAQDAAKFNYPIKVRIWQNVSHAFCNQDSICFDELTRNQAFKLTKQLIES